MKNNQTGPSLALLARTILGLKICRVRLRLRIVQQSWADSAHLAASTRIYIALKLLRLSSKLAISAVKVAPEITGNDPSKTPSCRA